MDTAALRTLDQKEQTRPCLTIANAPATRPSSPSSSSMWRRARSRIESQLLQRESQGKDPAAAALGRKGGQARAKSMTAEQRAQIAKQAAQKRWRDRSSLEEFPSNNFCAINHHLYEDHPCLGQNNR